MVQFTFIRYNATSSFSEMTNTSLSGTIHVSLLIVLCIMQYLLELDSTPVNVTALLPLFIRNAITGTVMLNTTCFFRFHALD